MAKSKGKFSFAGGPFLFSIPNRNGHPGWSLTFWANALGDGVTFALINNPPPAASINPNTGFFSWTPGTQDLGSRPITIQATDSAGLNATVTFQVTVGNQGPMLDAIPDLTIAVNQTLSFHVNAHDFEDDFPLTFSVIQGQGTIDGTGLYSFTSGTAGVYPVTIQVADSLGGMSQVPFNITVQ